MQNATRNETAPPWVALIYSAIEPVGSRGGGIHNAVIAHAVALQANGIDAVILTSSEACAKEARERAKIAVCDFLLDKLAMTDWDRLIGLLDAAGPLRSSDLRDWQSPSEAA